MAKKKEEKKEFVPSKYQSEIFDFIQHGEGNVVVEAAAGSGKTYTIIKCLELIKPEDKVLVTAFNKDIVEELKKKINLPNVDVKTLHGLGLRMLNSNFRKKIDQKPNTFKYQSYIYNNINELSEDKYYELDFKKRRQYLDNVIQLVEFGRYYLCTSIKDLEFIEERYGICTYTNEKEVALKVMEWGKSNIDTIDFTDMIWLPNELKLKPMGLIYDWIFVDECQDLQKAERELLLRCRKMSTRMACFGEGIQAINAFMGSDADSFQELRKLPNTISLPLSISYRCAENIVKYANKWNPTMESSGDGRTGKVLFDVSLDAVKDGDMIVCRTNAPLLQIYCKLVLLGKKCFIRGKDIGSNLKKLVESTKEKKLNINLRNKGVFSKLYDKLFDSIDDVMKKYHITFEMALEDMTIEEKLDTIEALYAIATGLQTSDELIERISSVFSDKKSNDGISLSTIHKAKGLEADNVYIACASLFDEMHCKHDWERQQEFNLEYVAYTRAKNTLGFLSEANMNKHFTNGMNIKEIREAVFKLYGRDKRCDVVIPTVDAAIGIMSNATKITRDPVNIKTITATTKTSRQSLKSITNKKVKKKKR